MGAYFGAECQKNGMLVRVAGDTIMMSPPFIISPQEVDEVILKATLLCMVEFQVHIFCWEFSPHCFDLQLISIYGNALKATEERVKELKAQR